MGNLLDFLITNLSQFRKARIPSLYSDFRQQQYSNPDGYTANLLAWELALAYAAEHQALPESSNTLSISSDAELLESLNSREFGAPASLGTVFSEAVSQGHFVPRAIFLNAKSGIVESGSSTSIPWRLASWAIRQLGLSGWVPDKLPSGEFVILANVKKANEHLTDLLSERRGRVERIWPVVEFSSAVADALSLKDGLSEDDLQVLLTYLHRDRKVLSYNESLVKFRASASEPLTITEEDRSIASLKTLIRDLTTQTNEISARIETLESQTRSALAAKNKPAALRHLRAKKVQETLLTQRSDRLAQLEDVLDQIESAVNQVEVVKVLQSSTSVLKGLNAEIRDIDSVQDILETLSEEVAKTKEIGDALGDPLATGGVVVDEGEIDDELAALEAQAQDKKTEEEVTRVQERLGQLPALDKEVPGLTKQANDETEQRHATKETA